MDQWHSLRDSVERAATELAALAATAPSKAAGSQAADAAHALRNLSSAHEAMRMLYAAERPPSPMQLTEADAAVRSADTAADGALGALDAMVRGESQPAPPNGPGGVAPQ
jgi:hypothetical protein